MMDLLFVGIGWTDLALALNRIAVGASRECRMSQLIESGPSRALAAEALLLREFSHRVGNEFAAAVGAISLRQHVDTDVSDRDAGQRKI